MSYKLKCFSEIYLYYAASVPNYKSLCTRTIVTNYTSLYITNETLMIILPLYPLLFVTHSSNNSLNFSPTCN